MNDYSPCCCTLIPFLRVNVPPKSSLSFLYIFLVLVTYSAFPSEIYKLSKSVCQCESCLTREFFSSLVNCLLYQLLLKNHFGNIAANMDAGCILCQSNCSN